MKDVVTQDEQWAVIRNAHGVPEFLVVAGCAPDTWIQKGNGKPGFASFDVYEIIAHDIRRKENGQDEWTLLGHFGFMKRDGQSSADPTVDLDEAARIAYGSVKWDGCANYTISEDEDLGYSTMLHACDLEDIRLLLEAVQLGYRLCAAIVDVEEDEPIHDGTVAEPVRPELAQPGTTGERTEKVEDWALEVYNPAIGAFTNYFMEAGVPFEVADRSARELLARLALLNPPLTIEKIR